MAALAYPDRIGLRRKGDAPRWVLSGGKGAAMAAGTPLAAARLIVATDLDGDALEAQVRQAVAISEAELRAVHGAQIGWRQVCHWSKREGRVMARRQECFGALVLGDQHWDAPAEDVARAALEGMRLNGLHFTPAARRFRARVELARGGGDAWPDFSDQGLMDSAEDWLLPHLGKCRTEADLRALDLTEPLRARLNWEQTQALDRVVPAVVGAKRLPLRVVLTSPGHKTIQVTMDLPGFWRSSYADVRKDMRGQYPRHPWPEDPTVAEPTLRAKPRGT